MAWTCTGQYFIVSIGENTKKVKKRFAEIKIWSTF